MRCDVCGTEVRPEHKFCMECGARLAHQTPDPAPAALPPAGGERGHPMFDSTTGQLIAVDGPGRNDLGPAAVPGEMDHDDSDTHDIDTGGSDTGGSDTSGTDDADTGNGNDVADDNGVDPDATSVLPALGRPETTFAPPDPTPGAGLPWSAVVNTAPEPPAPPGAGPEEYPPWPGGRGYAGDADLYGSYDAQADQPTRVQYLPDPYAGPPSYAPPSYAEPTPQPEPGYEPTGHLPATYQPARYEPVPYEPWEDEPVERPAFHIKPLFVVAILAIAAASVAIFTPVISVTAPGGAADLTGEWKINDFATNFAVAGIVVALTMLLGAVAWCGGFRWGAGMVGGAGAALAGWAVLPLGLAELQLSVSESAFGSSAEMTRDLGYWCLVGAGGIGIVVALISLLRAGNDRRAGLDPWVAALGAIATVVATIGPLIPLNGADLDGNWSSSPGSGWPFPEAIDLPSAFFAARFASLGMLLVCGVFGFLLVRRYGLGLAIGGAVGNGWLLLTAATGQTDSPLGPAYFNPGAEPNTDTLIEPYVVTIAGIALIFFFGIVAAAMAILDSE